jgi:hypothetical protein
VPADQPPVDEEKHRIPVVLLDVRPRREQMDLHARSSKVLLIFNQLIEEVFSKDLENSIAKSRRCGRGQDFETGP